MPAKRKKVLFLCTGNTCRSVMAEYMAKVKDEKGKYDFSSAGIAANAAVPVPQTVKKLLTEGGVKDFNHEPKSISSKMAAGADFIFAMEDFHKDYVIKNFPKAADKTQTWGIRDPIGGSEEVYRACWAEIKRALEAALPEL